MTTFAETTAVPAQRDRLLQILTKQINGDYTGPCLACDLREAGIHLTNEQLHDAINAAQLRADVEDEVVHWSQVIPEAKGDDLPGQALKAAQNALDATLAELIPGGRG